MGLEKMGMGVGGADVRPYDSSFGVSHDVVNLITTKLGSSVAAQRSIQVLIAS